MKLFLEGILFGLALALALGPIFVVTIHTALEKGRKAAFVVTSGIWISDLIFIITTYFFISKVSSIITDEKSSFWIALIGGIVLLLFGLGIMLKKSTFDSESFNTKLSFKSFSAYFVKGFLVNTVNPFTFIFWLGTMSTNVMGRGLSEQESFSFLSAILLTIIATDSAKVLLAATIREKLNQRIFNLITKIAGLGILIFGIYMIYHGFVN